MRAPRNDEPRRLAYNDENRVGGVRGEFDELIARIISDPVVGKSQSSVSHFVWMEFGHCVNSIQYHGEQ